MDYHNIRNSFDKFRIVMLISFLKPLIRMPIISRQLALLSDFLKTMFEDELVGGTSSIELEGIVPFDDARIEQLTTLFETLNQAGNKLDPKLFLSSDENVRNLIPLLEISHFLQIDYLHSFLISALNRLCRYDDPRLPAFNKSFNLPYCAGDLSRLNSAAKVWLELLTLPLEKQHKDCSVYSCLKLLSGKNIVDKVEKISHYTEDVACISIFQSLESKQELFSLTTLTMWARLGHLHTLQWAASQTPQLPWESVVCIEAAERGDIDMVKWLRAQEPPCPWDERVCAHVARSGNLELLQWLRAQEPPCPWDERTHCKAAKHGHLHIIKWASNNKCPSCNWITDEAAKSGDFETLKWLHEQGWRWGEDVFTNCVKNGFGIDVLRWLIEKECRWDDNTYCAAAQKGNLEILNLLYSHEEVKEDNYYHKHICDSAAKGGHLHVIKWARERGFPWSEKTFHKAMMSKDGALLRWLYENGFPLSEEILCLGAVLLDSKTVQWMYEAGCPGNAMICAGAAKSGKLDLLQFLREKDCPWNEYVPLNAAYFGHLEVLKWAIENGCPLDSETFRYSAEAGHVHILQWALGKGLINPLEPDVEVHSEGHYLGLSAVKGNALPVLEWLHSNGFLSHGFFEFVPLVYAVTGSHVKTAKWLYKNGFTFTDYSLKLVKKSSNRKMIAWIKEIECR
jgi:hypothetical protein